MARKSESAGSMMPGGVSPRKNMASGGELTRQEAHTGGGNFGVQSFSALQGHSEPHPDHVAKTGHKGAMADHERAIGDPLHHTKHHHPAQAAPDHGPHHPEGHKHHDRADQKAGEHDGGHMSADSRHSGHSSHGHKPGHPGHHGHGGHHPTHGAY